ncbi:MAG: hypothetical protein J6P60_05480 [Lachnospiraceae bacterium]|nr:hypothetical protein [Lachnospiraceae bacterium]
MMNQRQETIEIDLLELFYLLIDKIIFLLVAAILCGALGFGYTAFLTRPVYSATSKLYILTQSTSLTSLADIQVGTQLTQDYMELIKGRTVVEKVIGNLHLQHSYEEMLKQMSIQNPSNTRILSITISDYDSQTAKVIADEFANVSRKVISDIMHTDEPSIVEYGYASEKPVNIHIARNTLLGAMLGAILCAAFFIMRYLLNDTIKSSDDIEKYLGINMLAAIPIAAEEKATARRDKLKRKGVIQNKGVKHK